MSILTSQSGGPSLGLSTRTLGLLHDPSTWQAQGIEKDETLLGALVGGCVRAGLDKADTVLVIAHQGSAAGDRLRSAFGADLEFRIIEYWNGSRSRWSIHSTRVALWRHDVLTSWPYGARFNGGLRVTLGLARIADQSGKMAFTASVRQIAEAAGVGWVSETSTSNKTVISALKRLAADGLIIVEQAAAPSAGSSMLANQRVTLVEGAALRRALSGAGHQNPTTHPSNCVRLTACSGALTTLPLDDTTWLHVVFEESQHALGMSCCRVWHALSFEAACTVGQLVHLTGLGPRTARRAAARLEEAGLAVRHPDGEAAWARSGVTLDELAVSWGLADRQATRQRSNRYQRHARRAALAPFTAPHPDNVDLATGEIVRTTRRAA